MLNSATKPSRVRILVGTVSTDEAPWRDWQLARATSAYAQRIVVQRVSRSSEAAVSAQVGIGFGESLRWFAPIFGPDERRLIVAYAGAVLESHGFPDVPAALLPFLQSAVAASREPSVSERAVTEGLFLLSHAETDLLALEQARGRLPVEFPKVTAHSLLGVPSSEELLALFGEHRSPSLLTIVRIHGTVASVPGLTQLVGLAQREGWGLIVISGVGDATEMLPRTPNIKPEVAANLTAYFMAGGVANLSQALRYAAVQLLGLEIPFELPRVMPAHGLYHPDLLVTDTAEWEASIGAGQTTAAVVFYRAHVLSGNLAFVDVMLRALEARGFAAIGLFTSSLRDRDSTGIPRVFRLLTAFPDIVVNTISFPVFTLSPFESTLSAGDDSAPFTTIGAPLIQAICCGTPRALWHESARGLAPAEAAMNVALPECDGRIIAVPVSFKESHRYVPDPERTQRVADLAQRLATLRRKPAAQVRVAIVLSNAGGKAQRVGGAVGLDTPASLLRWLADMRRAGYGVGPLPESADELMGRILADGCYDDRHPIHPETAWRKSRASYCNWFHAQGAQFQRSLTETWGEPNATGPTIPAPFWRDNKQSTRRSPLLSLREPHTDQTDYLFSGLAFWNVVVAIQPPRGFGVDPEVVYHAPDLPPCHHYAAFYRWLAEDWKADAVIHFGTHGTLEWLPGKSIALSAECAPDALLGDLPLIYPFVVNNPGEGAQAKRRTHAVIIDHLVPPLTHADTYGPLATLARLVEEYYRAEVLDTNKLPVLRRQVWDLVRTERLEDDLKQIRVQRHGNHEHPWDERTNEEGIPRALDKLSGRGFAHLLEDLDAYLCDLGRAQIRGGLHVFGAPPEGTALIDLLFAVLRSPNGNVPSLVDAVTRAVGIDPVILRAAHGVWAEPVPQVLRGEVSGVLSAGHVRTALDDLSRVILRELAGYEFSAAAIDEMVARRFAKSSEAARSDLDEVLRFTCETLAPALARTTDETRHLLAALSGAYVPAGPSGSPSRGMAHVLPTGRNFYTVDPRGLPTPAAWATGSGLAREALARHFAEKGQWPESIALTVWGTPTMRTGGDDIAQALALIGVRPLWEVETRRARGFEVIPLAELARPRIDVTLRVSGFFRDAFPALMHLFDEAVQRVARLEESESENFIRKHWLAEVAILERQGCDVAEAQRRASYRVFSSKPGAYGTGLMQLMDSSQWRDSNDLAEAFLLWGGWAFSPQTTDGVEAVESFRRKLAGVDLVLHNQDNLEQDVFDSTDYFEFQGGLVAATAAVAEHPPSAYFGDSSDPTRPRVRTLQAETLRVYRSRVVNPKWLEAMRRHGYRGGLEMAATVDAMFGFAATAGVVTDWMFEGIAANFADGPSRAFLEKTNPWALNAIVERLVEAQQRQLWSADPLTLKRLRETLLESEAAVEETTESLS